LFITRVSGADRGSLRNQEADWVGDAARIVRDCPFRVAVVVAFGTLRFNPFRLNLRAGIGAVQVGGSDSAASELPWGCPGTAGVI